MPLKGTPDYNNRGMSKINQVELLANFPLIIRIRNVDITKYRKKNPVSGMSLN